MDKMSILHLEQSDWVAALQVSPCTPGVIFDYKLGKMAIFFESRGLGRVFLGLARGGVRLWSPEACARFLGGLGLGWSVEHGCLGESGETVGVTIPGPL